MSTYMSIPRIDVPIGRATAAGLVYFDANFLRTFLQQLSDRVGGSKALSNVELEELAGQVADMIPRTNIDAAEAIAAVDELRNELASVRSDCDALRNQIADRDVELAALRIPPDLSGRVQQLEDRLV